MSQEVKLSKNRDSGPDLRHCWSEQLPWLHIIGFIHAMSHSAYRNTQSPTGLEQSGVKCPIRDVKPRGHLFCLLLLIVVDLSWSDILNPSFPIHDEQVQCCMY